MARDKDSDAGLSPYVVPPTIPEGMTMMAYQRSRPAKPSLRQRAAAWAQAAAMGGAAGLRHARRAGALAGAAAVAVALALPAGALAQESFSGPTNFPTGGDQPSSVAVGDFNRDGDPDLAVATDGSEGDTGEVSVLLGEQEGGFGTASKLPANGPESIAVGHFDSDSDPDLAIVNAGNDTVSVRLGQGGGTFGSPTHVDTGRWPRSVAVGDFNGDSQPDLAVANSLSDDVSVLLGEPDGEFTAAPTVSTGGNSPVSVAVGHFNLDRDLDLAVANSFSDTVSVLQGDGAGEFLLAQTLDTGDQPHSVAVGDFNGDHDPDLAVANSSSSTVSILLGDVGPRFHDAESLATLGTGAYSVAVGAFDGDSNLDLAVANRWSDNVSVRFGNGDGTFDWPQIFSTGSSGARPWSVAVGDFNDDFDPDLAVANFGSDDVAVLLNNTNRSPAAAEDEYTADENSPLTVAAPGVLANDSDPDADGLTAELESGPEHGSLALEADGSFVYTPHTDYDGSDSFTYRAKDRSPDSDTATVTIEVNGDNDAPAASDDTYETDEDTTLTIEAAGVLGNDSDPEGDSLQAAWESGPEHGSLELAGDGSFIYTPDPNFNGSDTFSYRARDGALDSGAATVAIEVNAVNDTPVAADDVDETDEDTSLTLAAPGVLGNDSDPDGDDLRAVRVLDVPDRGDLRLNSDGSFTYTPWPDFSGRDRFAYAASDGDSESEATLYINVKPVNDAPAANDDAYQTDEDTTLTIEGAGVLGNDSDLEGDALSAAVVSGPEHGSVELNQDGSLNYTPHRDYNGSDSFRYHANDGNRDSGAATVTIDVDAVDDAPAADGESYEAEEDTPLNVEAPGVLSNDSDPDGDDLSAALISGPAHGTLELNANGSLTYTPTRDYNGGDSFTYETSDGNLESNTATVTLEVKPVNDAPAAAGDTYFIDEDMPLRIGALGVLGNDSDREGDALTAVLEAGPAHGSLELYPHGSLWYTPDGDYNGSDTFTYRANDGGLNSDPATVTIELSAVEDAPRASGDAFATEQDTPLSAAAPGVLANDADPEGGSLTAALISGPGHGTLELNPDGSFLYTPDSGYNGSDSFSYRASDGGLDSDPVTATIEVRADAQAAPGATPGGDSAAAPPAGAAPAAGPAAPTGPAIAQLRLGSRCVRPSRSGRVRIPMTLRMARPGPVQVRIDRAVGTKNTDACVRPNPGRRFRRVALLRRLSTQPAAAGRRRVTLSRRLAPGLYRITVRAHLENDQLSRPARRYLRVLG